MHSPTLVSSLILLLFGIARAAANLNGTEDNESVEHSDKRYKAEHLESTSPNNRTKRFLYYTSEQRLMLPPGTLFILEPKLKLPLVRNAPLGYGFASTLSPVIIKIQFDDLGLTSEENPWALWPDFGIFRKKREAWSPFPGVNWAGGDREVMFQVLEDSLSNVGLPGKQCLLRAICEMFETPLLNHGFMADVMELFFSVSKSPHADTRLNEYLEAETLGKHHKSCSKFYSGCEHSLFTHNGQSKWTQPAGHEEDVKIKHEDVKIKQKDVKIKQKGSQQTSAVVEDPLLGTDEDEILDNYINNHIDEHDITIM